MKIKSFEDIKSWQKARDLNRLIYKITLESEKLNKDFGLRDQMRRSSISISSNIAEGFDRETNKEFIRFLYIAKGSAAELRSQIILAYDISYFNEFEYRNIINRIDEISKLIFGLIKYLKTTIKVKTSS